MNRAAIGSVALALLVLTGCQERYRYPCQDPNNWDLKECQKPHCSANGTCPEDLRHYEKEPSSAPTPQQPNRGASSC